MSIIQVKPYSTLIGGPWRTAAAAPAAAVRRITAVLALWRSRAAARRRQHEPRHMDDRLLADIGLTRMDLKLPARDFIFWW
jgi:uncharacterized protein YjiS (DUF1127 family)